MTDTHCAPAPETHYPIQDWVLTEWNHVAIPQLCLQGCRGRPKTGPNSFHHEEARTFVFSAIPLASLFSGRCSRIKWKRFTACISICLCHYLACSKRRPGEGILQLQSQIFFTGGKVGIRNRKILFAWSTSIPWRDSEPLQWSRGECIWWMRETDTVFE